MTHQHRTTRGPVTDDEGRRGGVLLLLAVVAFAAVTAALARIVLP